MLEKTNLRLKSGVWSFFLFSNFFLNETVGTESKYGLWITVQTLSLLWIQKTKLPVTDVLLLFSNTFSFCLQYFKVCTGNLYEGEKLNFLTVIQLLNEALRILRDESYRFDSKNHLQPIVNMATLQSKMLLRLEAVR